MRNGAGVTGPVPDAAELAYNNLQNVVADQGGLHVGPGSGRNLLLVAFVQLVGEVVPAVVGADGELAVVGVALEVAE